MSGRASRHKLCWRIGNVDRSCSGSAGMACCPEFFRGRQSYSMPHPPYKKPSLDAPLRLSQTFGRVAMSVSRRCCGKTLSSAKTSTFDSPKRPGSQHRFKIEPTGILSLLSDGFQKSFSTASAANNGRPSRLQAKSGARASVGRTNGDPDPRSNSMLHLSERNRGRASRRWNLTLHSL